MMHLSYLAGLMVGIVGIGMIDRRFGLALYADKIRTIWTVAICVGFFLLWDVMGIVFGVFYAGDSVYITGVMLAPDLPLEEPVFLVLLSYQALVCVQAGRRIWPRI